MTVGLAELVTHVRGNAWLDAARTECDQEKTGDQPTLRVERGLQERTRHIDQRERAVTDAVDDREQHDRPVLPEERVGNDRAEDWEEVRACDEEVHVLTGLRVGEVRRFA